MRAPRTFEEYRFRVENRADGAWAPLGHHVCPVTPDLGRIADAVQACPAVAGLHGGRFGGTVTHLPAGRLVGLTASDTEIVVGVIGVYPAGVVEIAAQVRAAVHGLAPGMDVAVNVEDLHVPDTEADGAVQAGLGRVRPGEDPDQV